MGRGSRKEWRAGGGRAREHGGQEKKMRAEIKKPEVGQFLEGDLGTGGEEGLGGDGG